MTTKKPTLEDVSHVKKVVKEFLLLTRPTISGFCRSLGVTPKILWAFVEDNPEHESTNQIIDAYQYIIEVHESRLFDKGFTIPSIFYLKTARRFGYCFDDGNNGKKELEDISKIKKLKFEYKIVKRGEKDID